MTPPPPSPAPRHTPTSLLSLRRPRLKWSRFASLDAGTAAVAMSAAASTTAGASVSSRRPVPAPCGDVATYVSLRRGPVGTACTTSLPSTVSPCGIGTSLPLPRPAHFKRVRVADRGPPVLGFGLALPLLHPTPPLRTTALQRAALPHHLPTKLPPWLKSPWVLATPPRLTAGPDGKPHGALCPCLRPRTRSQSGLGGSSRWWSGCGRRCTSTMARTPP